VIVVGPIRDFVNNLYVKKGVLKYLRENSVEGEPVALVKVDGAGVITVVHDFSTDPRILAAALEKVWRKLRFDDRQLTTTPDDIDGAPQSDSSGQVLSLFVSANFAPSPGLESNCATADATTLLARLCTYWSSDRGQRLQ
jgi:hypothetical protein